jgi:hypothetical protein
MQGCTTCTKQALKRYRGSDEDLLAIYQAAKSEVEQHFQKNNLEV